MKSWNRNRPYRLLRLAGAAAIISSTAIACGVNGGGDSAAERIKSMTTEVSGSDADPTPGTGRPDLVGKSVFLDPGHSGSNDSSISRQVPDGRGGTKDCQTTGTSTNSGYAEHTFNWDVVMRIREALESMGVKTQVSRPDDTGTGPCIDQRAAEANEMRPDAIVSVHADGAPDWGQGFHIIYSAPPLNDAQAYASVDFATLMRDTLRSRGFKASNYLGSEGLIGRADLAGLNFYAYPGILVELGNMRNPDEAAKMETPQGRENYAAAVVDGIVAYLQQSR
jgi:N-acetylmuramoyl-L-alanine amidase